MQVRCIRPFSQYQPGDIVDVPDGAAVYPFHWEPAEEAADGDTGSDPAPAAEADPGSAAPAAAPAAAVPLLPYPAKEM